MAYAVSLEKMFTVKREIIHISIGSSGRASQFLLFMHHCDKVIHHCDKVITNNIALCHI